MLHSSLRLNMKKFGLLITLTSTLLNFSACNNSGNYSNDPAKLAGNLRQLSQNERAQDFDQLLTLFKTYYGPYNYKEKLLKINIEQEAARLKTLAASAKTDEEFAGYVMQLGAILRDGHIQISIENTSTGISVYRIPILLTQIENRTIIGDIAPDLSKELGLQTGDEVLEMDGKAPADYMPTILKYDRWATKLSENHLIYALLSRPSYMTELIPTATTARLKIKKANDSIQVHDIPWTVRKYNADLDRVIKSPSAEFKPLLDLKFSKADEMNSVTSNISAMGATVPFFLSELSQKKYNFIKVYPSDASRKKAGLEEKEKPDIYAALYKYQNKNILLVRSSTYSPRDYKPAVYLKAYTALLNEFQDIADILVLDQTHNPGGSYCSDFYNLFANEMDVQTVQRCNADRKWINNLQINWPNQIASVVPWDARLTQTWGMTIEQAYDSGKRLSDPIPFFTGSTFSSGNSVWKKPMLVLIDELAGSCGDIFPMLVKANKRAKLFGQQTMGLGGNVEEVGILNNSRISVRMTRGLFSAYKEKANYEDADFVENNGVNPDVAYSHTVKDFRAGYIDYIKAFSDEAIKEIK